MSTPGAAAQGTTEPAAGSQAAGATGAATSSTSSAAPAAGTSQPAAAATQPGASAGDPKAGEAGKTGAAAAAPGQTAAAPGQTQETKKDASQAQTQVVPDKYELKLPEKSPLDAAHIAKVAAIAKEQGLTNEEAQAYLEHDSEVATSVLEAQQQTTLKMQEGWLNACKADKEIGGEGLGQNAEAAKRVIEKHGSPELLKFLDDSKLGNHPEYVRLMSRIHREYMAEDKMVIVKAPPPKAAFEGEQAMADKLYGAGGKEGSAQQ